MKFLKENWIWIVAPIVLFAILITVIMVMGSQPEDQHGYLLR